MRVVAAIALTAAILFAGASPSVAFDTPNFGRHAVEWQNKSERVVKAMTTRNVLYSVRRLNSLAWGYVSFLSDVEGRATTCQKSNGFPEHQDHVMKYALFMQSAVWEARANRWRSAAKMVKLGVRQYNLADDDGARVLRNCW